MSLAFLRPTARDVTFTEVDTGYRLTVDLHGLSAQEIRVSVLDDLIAIEGVAQAQASEERDDGVSPSSLRCWIGLPPDADLRTVAWRSRCGLLVVTIDRVARCLAA